MVFIEPNKQILLRKGDLGCLSKDGVFYLFRKWRFFTNRKTKRCILDEGHPVFEQILDGEYTTGEKYNKFNFK